MRTTAFLLVLALTAYAGGTAAAQQTDAESAGAPPILPVASLTDGVWLKGDLHVHSRHSKDSSNNPISKIIAFAEKVGVDFLCISDHDNHVGGDVAHHTWADPELKSHSVLLLYGAEWTTHRGHANPFSAKPYDHQRFYDVRDQRDVVIGAVKKELGLHLSANHPSNGDQFGFSYDLVDSIEVWNSAVWSRNANSIVVWDDMLKSGRKLTGRGGSDSHHGHPDRPELAAPNSWQAPANNVGTPTTWVFAKERTLQAVIDALTNGRVSVSANPYAPRVEFSADLDQDGNADMMMGDNSRPTGKPVAFRVQLAGNTPPGATYTVSVTKDGGLLGNFQATAKTPGSWPIVEFTDTPAAEGRTYYRVQVEGPPTNYPEVPESAQRSGNMVGLSNPIFFNFDPNF